MCCSQLFEVSCGHPRLTCVIEEEQSYNQRGRAMATQNIKNALVCAEVAVSSLLIAAVAQAQDVSFEEAQSFGTGCSPFSIAVGDFNSDGKQDLAVANVCAGVSVLLGNGDGTFQEPRNFRAGSVPRCVAVGDFNRDGVQDLAL